MQEGPTDVNVHCPSSSTQDKMYPCFFLGYCGIQSPFRDKRYEQFWMVPGLSERTKGYELNIYQGNCS
ncbi:hypothetical protein Y1Q_0001235 [Alligator mississippiensis]|uniref:Uncharacterized protein n=1 Tax=Alligator mississippiensis TaxID=8496 RepID=A0A151PEE2_ALLMI|nr:hypothetical protein Y1Q_0001235 [Alligator mississippiensis]